MTEEEQNALNRAFIRYANRRDVPEMALLLKKGADVNATDEKGYTALMTAVCLHSPNVAEFLISEGIDLEAACENYSHGNTALHMAVSRKMPDMARMLLDAGADINARNAYMDTPLFYALNDLGMLNMMIEAGADITLCDEQGVTPLMSAVSKGQPAAEAVKTLLALKPNLEAKDVFGNTALHRASDERGSGCRPIRLLLEAGADINAVNDAGMTPLMSAVSFGKTEAAKTLMEAGADLEAKDKDGRTPLVLATKGASIEMVRLLAEAGAELEPAGSLCPPHDTGAAMKAVIEEIKKERLETELSVFQKGLSRPMKATKPFTSKRGPG